MTTNSPNPVVDDAQATSAIEIKRPKRMRDWVGARVKTLHIMENGYARLPAGSVGTVTGVGSGFYLTFDYCSCCNMGVKVSHVRPEHLEIIELPSFGIKG